MLVELFYLPYHHGALAQELLEHFRWLRANSLSVGVPATAPDACGVRLLLMLLQEGEVVAMCRVSPRLLTHALLSPGHAVARPGSVLPAALRADVPPAQPPGQHRGPGAALRPAPLSLGHPEPAAGRQCLHPLAGYVADASPASPCQPCQPPSHLSKPSPPPDALWGSAASPQRRGRCLGSIPKIWGFSVQMVVPGSLLGAHLPLTAFLVLPRVLCSPPRLLCRWSPPLRA